MNARSAYPHLVIRASAGTGKTHQLAVRFIGLLAAGARPEEILATTFTRKAAGEILDRVLYRLAQAAGDEAERGKLAAEIGDTSLTPARCRELLRDTLRKLHGLRVGTLDSYFIQVASSFGQELALPPGWSICDELMDAALRDEAIELMLADRKSGDLLTLVHSLTKGEAKRSVSQLVHSAVAGLWELYRETTPEAWEAIQPPRGLPDSEFERTLKLLAALDLKDKRMRTARDGDLARAQAGDWDKFIDTGLAKKIHLGERDYYNKLLPDELVSLYRKLLAHAESVLVGQIVRQTTATHELLAHFREHYHALQLDERALRFGDVTHKLSEAGQIIAPERLAFRLGGGIRHVLLDEFQDTSPIQWRVIRPLAQCVTGQAGGSFFCVGDAKQAIYGWRGGVAEIFDALEGELAGLTTSGLAKSYRSSQPVIDAVNQVFQNLAAHPHLDKLAEPVERWQRAFPPHTTARTDLAGHVTLETAPAAGEGEDQSERLWQHAAQRVQQAVAQAPRASVGVLVRTNAAVARMIFELRRLRVSASEEGGNPLIDSPAVELILSLLKLADHPGDRVARFHLATSPLSKSVAELVRVRTSLNSNEFGYDHSAAAVRLSRRLRRQLLDEGYGATVNAWAQRLAESCDARDLSRLQQLVELAYEYQPKSTLRTDDFLRLVQSRRIADPTSSDVRVMTIHQAKGLQFDVVFLPELNAGLTGQPGLLVAGRPGPTQPVNVVCRYANEHVRQFFPPRLQKLFEEDMRREVTEALCVLYVAMTRAIHALHLIIPPAAANERSLRRNYAGLLRATLAPDRDAGGGQMLYEHGDRNWPARGERRQSGSGGRQPPEPFPPAPSASSPGAHAPRSLAICLAPPPARRDRGLERTSPSHLEGGPQLSAADALGARAAKSLNIGTLIHAWLEQIAWLDDGLPADEALRQTALRLRSEIGDVSADLDGLIAAFRRQVAAPAVAAALKRSYYAGPANLGLSESATGNWPAGDAELVVHRERRFAVRHGGELLTGSIDRLVTIRARGQAIAADVIDFKTDALKAGDAAALAQRVEFYRPQIAAYRAAVSRLLRLDEQRIAARLVFLAAGLVHRL